MPSEGRELPHLYLSNSGEAEAYTSPRTPRERAIPERNRAEHAVRLEQSISVAVAEGLHIAQETLAGEPTGSRGLYLEFSVPKGQADVFDKLENRQKQIELVSIHPSPDGGALATVFVPEAQADF